MGKFQSSKIFDGFSTVFRQWKADETHCRFLHGYGISFKVYFEGELDNRNWVWDFGGMKRAKTLIEGKQPKAWMDYMFDHTVIIAEDDPGMGGWKTMDAEKFAEYIFNKINPFVEEETDGRVRVTKVKFMEHGKNAAYYVE